MSKNLKDIVITAALRTPIGRYNGLFKDKHAHELGSIVIKEILNKSNLKPNDIDEVIMGQVLTGLTGQDPARQAAILSNILKKNCLLDKSSLWIRLEGNCCWLSISIIK